MEISCDIIKDLLPLYAEDMVSADSRKMVDEHLCDCGDCRGALDKLKASAVISDVDIKPLENLGKKIRKSRWVTAIFVLLTAAAVLFGVALYLTTPVYLTAEEAIENIIIDPESGFVDVELNTVWYDIDYYTYNAESGKIQEREANLIAYRDRLGVCRGKLHHGMSDIVRVWYYGTQKGEGTIMVAGESRIGASASLEQHEMRFFAIAFMASALILGMIAVPLWNRRGGKCAVCAAVFLIMYAAALWILTNGEFVTHDPLKVYILGAVQAVLTCAALITGSYVRKTYH